MNIEELKMKSPLLALSSMNTIRTSACPSGRDPVLPFPDPVPGVDFHDFAVEDTVVVPDDIAEGDYVLGWRSVTQTLHIHVFVVWCRVYVCLRSEVVLYDGTGV